MCDVRPFCGLRYNLQLAGAASTVISPPYDVISPEQRALFYQANPYNIIRVEYGADEPDDNADRNKYTRAAATLDGWIRDKIVIRDTQPSFYVIEHSFSHRDSELSRWGLFAKVRLEDFESGRIRPHERTNTKPAADRLELLRACHTNVSPIMGLFRTENGEMAARFRELASGEPALSAEDGQGVTYRLWVINDRETMDEISGFFTDRDIYIADGHHRYQTALQHKKERQASASSHNGDEPHDFVMMSLMDSQDPGIVMQPTHRLVRGLAQALIAELEDKISPFFELELPLPMTDDAIQGRLDNMGERGKEGAVLGLYGLHEQQLCLLKLRPNADLGGMLSPEELRLWKNLDVALLQRIVLQEGLGIRTLDEETDHLDYTRDALLARQQVDAGKHQLAFFLNPAPVSGILASAAAGKRLPQKSTYFHPKTPTGLVMNPLWEQE